MPMTRTASSTTTPRRRRRPQTGDVAGSSVRVELTLEHFERFCGKLVLDNGKHFRLEPFQRTLLSDYFAGTRETLALLPSGQGKTTLFAALALHHLLFYRDGDGPEVFIMASSRGQAGRMLEHVKGFVTRSHLGQYVVVKRREVVLRRGKGFIEILASDADTADGIGPTLALIDELHRHKTTALYEVALKGLKKRQGRILHCSTAGETVRSPLGEIRARCLALPGVRREGMHTYARAASGALAFHEWALGPDDDMHDMAVVKQANPLKSITIEDLEAEHEAMKSWAWARFACGLWVAGEGSAVSPIDWAACNYTTVELSAAHPHLLVADIAFVNDCTAINAVQALSRTDVRAKKVAILQPAGDGTALREEQILKPVRDWVSEHPTCSGIVVDPELCGRPLCEKFEDLGLEVIEHSQKNEPMCDAYGKLDQVIRGRIDDTDPDSRRVLQVEEDPVLTAHVLNAHAKPMPDGKAKLVKRRKNPEPVDGVVSLAMGVRVALGELDQEPPERMTVEVWA
jgi:phage terminase large subunit-like protein